MRNDSNVLPVRRNLLADGRARWLALVGSVIVAGGMIYDGGGYPTGNEKYFI